MAHLPTNLNSNGKLMKMDSLLDVSVTTQSARNPSSFKLEDESAKNPTRFLQEQENVSMNYESEILGLIEKLTAKEVKIRQLEK